MKNDLIAIYGNNQGVGLNSKELYKIILNELIKRKPNKIDIVCIGTDRCSGDSLGPFVGSMLKRRRALGNVEIHGSLDKTVNARNVEEVGELLKGKETFVVAVDASLGVGNAIGSIVYQDKGIEPGKGVRKNLSTIGDIAITGIVNMSSANFMAVLNSTSLNTVTSLASKIESSLTKAIKEYNKLTYENNKQH